MTRDYSKLTSVLVSLFAANYVLHWPAHMTGTPLLSAPAFDARAVCYPSDAVLRDYLAWRQADCHVNNQYNAPFWALVQQGGLSREAAQAELRGTQAEAKNELLFSRFGVNYTHLPALHRKGSVLFRRRAPEEVKTVAVEGGADGGASRAVMRLRSRVVVEHVDIISEAFWSEHPELLAG